MSQGQTLMNAAQLAKAVTALAEASIDTTPTGVRLRQAYDCWLMRDRALLLQVLTSPLVDAQDSAGGEGDLATTISSVAARGRRALRDGGRVAALGACAGGGVV
jgi:hypothetical protein